MIPANNSGTRGMAMKLIKTKAACQAMTLETIPVLPSPCCFRRGITNAADFMHAGTTELATYINV